MFCSDAPKAKNLSCKFIDEAISSGYFLKYIKDTGTFDATLMRDALFQLKHLIEKMQKMSDSVQQILVQFENKYIDARKTENNITLPNDELYIPLVLADRQQDIVNLSIAIIKGLEGNMINLQNLEINPPAPFIRSAELIKEETPNIDEIKNWLSTF